MNQKKSENWKKGSVKLWRYFHSSFPLLLLFHSRYNKVEWVRTKYQLENLQINHYLANPLYFPKISKNVVFSKDSEMIWYSLLNRNKTKSLIANKDPPVSMISTKIIKELELIRKKFSNPIISCKKIVKKKTKHNSDYRKV